MEATAPAPKGHPKGLYILFFTELWERFSFYGMRALFTLFLVASTTARNPGFGWTNEQAIALYGWYTMLVYLASVPGGIIADRWLGQKKTVMLGGILLCIGHAILTLKSVPAFYIGCLFIILGVGGLKPNISTMVGGLYKKGDERRDKGFYIFYIGINIGAFLAPIACGFIGERINWHYGFGLAAIGMLVGQLVFIWGQKYLKGVGGYIGAKNSPDKEFMKKPLTKVEKDRILVLILSFLIIIVFWGAFEQAGGLLNLYAKQNTNRNLMGFVIPASVFQSINSFFIFTLATTVAAFWYKRKMKGKESSSIFKMAIGVIILGFSFIFMACAAIQFKSAGSSAMYWLVLFYLFQTIGELCASPVSLSYITKLAPVKYASIMMGAYWAATGLGNKLAGLVGEWASSAGDLQIFLGILIFCMVFGLLVIALLKPLKRLAHGAEDLQPFTEAEAKALTLEVEGDKIS
jgi:proton-dependent oligopeptide transporter, POT family